MQIKKQSDFSKESIKKLALYFKNQGLICDYYWMIAHNYSREKAMKEIMKRTKWSRATFFRRLNEFHAGYVI